MFGFADSQQTSHRGQQVILPVENSQYLPEVLAALFWLMILGYYRYLFTIYENALLMSWHKNISQNAGFSDAEMSKMLFNRYKDAN
jgi:hypothetical protein